MGGGGGDACGIKLELLPLKLYLFKEELKLNIAGGQTLCKVSSPEIVCFQGNDEV